MKRERPGGLRTGRVEDKDDVGGLDVAVHLARGVQNGQQLRELLHHGQLLTEAPRLRRPLRAHDAALEHDERREDEAAAAQFNGLSRLAQG